MSTYDDGLLGTRFALLAPEPLAGSWDDVLGRTGATRKSGRRRLVIAFAVVAVAAAIAAAAVGGVRDFILRTGFIGLPPIGATPSSPASGELEIWYWAWWAADGEPFFWATNRNVKWGRTRAWVYADGRLITWGGPTVPGARTLCPPDSSSSGSRPKGSSAFAPRSRRPVTSAVRTSWRRRRTRGIAPEA